MTWTDLINSALAVIGHLGIGRGANPSELTRATLLLNSMLDAWNIDRRAVYTIRVDAYDLVGGKRAYTIGPSGADLTAPRPVKVENANLVFNDVTPVVRRPLELIGDGEFAELRLQEIADSVPMKLYYDGGFVGSNGLATIYLYPGPASTWKLELFTWQQLTQVSNIASTIAMPPGYPEALKWNLAVRFGEEWNRPARQTVVDLAVSTRNAIDALNLRLSLPTGNLAVAQQPVMDGK